MEVLSPAKIIVSGEHSVLYGQPALAMAVNYFARTRILTIPHHCVKISLEDLKYKQRITQDTLCETYHSALARYRDFVQGKAEIQTVLTHPAMLVQCAVVHFLETMAIPEFPRIRMEVQSDIPMGCGMGSSAATVVSVLYALGQYCQKTQTLEQYFDMARTIENLQHGHSSGVDVCVTLHGGGVYYHDRDFDTCRVPSMPFHLVHTGEPMSSTGECVAQVKKCFQPGDAIWQDFGDITRTIYAAMQAGKALPDDAIRANQNLLTTIGVVPAKVQQCVAELSEVHATAKICGAGSVRGEGAGMMLLLAEDMAAAEAICARYGYKICPAQAVEQGVRNNGVHRLQPCLMRHVVC